MRSGNKPRMIKDETMSNTATVITTKAGEALIAQMQAENKVLVIDKFIFANVPNRPAFPNRDDVVPAEHVVHESAVHEQGRLTENSVIYSTTLASNVGPFSFNWSGLFCSEHNVLVAINFPPPVDKTVDAPGITGNTLVRSFVLEYKGISETTNITVDPSSWQYDAHKRMSKMDNDTAQAIIDQNGKDWFIDDGFIVTPQSGAYSIKAGAGYVSGHRISLEFDRIIQAPEKPAFIYVDAFREGSPTGEWQTKFTFVVAADEKDDYTDAQGVNHFVCKIAQVLADGSVSDLRCLPKKDDYKKLSGFMVGNLNYLRCGDNSVVIDGVQFVTHKALNSNGRGIIDLTPPYSMTVGDDIYYLMRIDNYISGKINLWSLGAGDIKYNNAVLNAAIKCAKSKTIHGNQNSVFTSPVEIDFGGRELVLTESFECEPLTSGISFVNGSLTPFVVDKLLPVRDYYTVNINSWAVGTPLMNFDNPNKNIDFQYLNWDRLFFNCRHTAAGLSINKYMNCTIGVVHFLNVNNFGLRTGRWANYNGPSGNYPNRGDDSEGHELQVGKISVCELDFADRYNNPDYQHQSVALDINTPDNNFDQVIVSSARLGARFSISPNNVTTAHFYGCQEAAVLQHAMNGGYVTFGAGCYFDGCPLVVEDPSQLSVCNTVFLSNNGSEYIELKGIKKRVLSDYSISLVNNTFNNNTNNVHMVRLTGTLDNKEGWESLSRQNITLNNFYGFVPIKQIDCQSWREPELDTNHSGTALIPLSSYFSYKQPSNYSGKVAQFIYTAHWVSSNDYGGFGGYNIYLTRTPSGKYLSKIIPIDGEKNLVQEGFLAKPTVNDDGLLSISLKSSYAGVLTKNDYRNVPVSQ